MQAVVHPIPLSQHSKILREGKCQGLLKMKTFFLFPFPTHTMFGMLVSTPRVITIFVSAKTVAHNVYVCTAVLALTKTILTLLTPLFY